LETNESGIVPQEFKVLVLPDVEETLKRAARANIMVPEEAARAYQTASTIGRVIAIADAAFSFNDWPDGARLPKVGDTVVFARHSGLKLKGRPETNAKGYEEAQEYRLINDRDIAAILEF